MTDIKIKNLGEQLHPILWNGRQWAVTTYGIECRDGRYAIKKERLSESNHGFGWVQHMSEKLWVDQDDFEKAFNQAVLIHAASKTK